jgi:hypothetical protein
MKAPTGKLAFAYRTISELEARRDKLRVEVEALKKDAERYRTLRHSLSGKPGSSHTEMPQIHSPFHLEITYTPDGLDAAIDAAMAAKEVNP